MLELTKTERGRCKVALDNLRVSKVRRALVVYFRELGLPNRSAWYVATRILSKSEHGIRCYLLPNANFILVNYDKGSVVVGSEEHVVDAAERTHSWEQGYLWTEMARFAARGKRMSAKQIREFIWEIEPEKGLMCVNVAPMERRRRRRKRN